MRPNGGRRDGGPGDEDSGPPPHAVDLIVENVRDAPPREVPGRLCAVALRLLPVSGASVSLRAAGLPVRLCASGERAAYLSEIQATLGDGPCVEAGASGAPVLARDLTAAADAARWPVYAQQATAAGVRAVYALPLGAAGSCVGTLDLYRDTPGGLTGAELSTARLVAGVMTTALMALPHGVDYEEEDEPGHAAGDTAGDPAGAPRGTLPGTPPGTLPGIGRPSGAAAPPGIRRAVRPARALRPARAVSPARATARGPPARRHGHRSRRRPRPAPHLDADGDGDGIGSETDAARRWMRHWLGGLGGDHDEVHQAVGMIMAQLGVGADEALARLRAHAFVHGRTAREVAHAMVTHRERIDRDP